MTPEWAQVFTALTIGLLQCGLIAWGIQIMKASNASREETNKKAKANTEVLQGIARTLNSHTDAFEKMMKDK